MATTSRARPSKPYKVVKPKKDKRRTTESQRNFRFQSFSERITNLKIDPIRKRRYVEGQDDLPEVSSTYFGNALQEWMDMNLTTTFTNFAKEAVPLCDSLPVVLHNEHKIMDVLVRYIEMADEKAMEPLLSLMSHFAHDLDTRFEKHFSRAVATVTAVAAAHKDFEVIEWSFTCLAWLFKYLSRLLAPDLRPLYDLMAPYLGRSHQKPFVVRFTAESLSFLLRKAADVQRRDSQALDIIIRHILEQCAVESDSNGHDLHKQGIMTLLTEATKGVQGGIHSCGLPIIKSMIETGLQMDERSSVVVEDILAGTLTSLIHHCNAETFGPVTEVILEAAKSPALAKNPQASGVVARAMFTIVSVRKGTRIQQWRPVLSATMDLLSICQGEQDTPEQVMMTVLAALAVIIQTATMDAVHSAQKISTSIRTGRLSPYFLRFCDMCLRLGVERFEMFVRPQFQAYIDQQAGLLDQECLLLIKRLPSAEKLRLSTKTSDALLSDLETLSGAQIDDLSVERLATYDSMLAVFAVTKLEASSRTRLQKLLRALVDRSLKISEQGSQDLQRLGLGRALGLLLDMEISDAAVADLLPSLCDATTVCTDFPQFWSNLLRLFRRVKPDDHDSIPFDTLETAILKCLSSPSHSLRQDALDLLQILYKIRGIEEPSSLATMILIESTPISLETSRSISMNVRRLGAEYATIAATDSMMQKALPSYCFGLLHVHLAQAWDDAINALQIVCNSNQGEDIVISLAQTWIEGEHSAFDDTMKATSPLLDVESDGFRVFSDFECPNLAKLTAISEQVFQEPLGGAPAPTTAFRADHERIQYFTATSRSQALKLLNKIPQVAEKRSRLLVPVLLRWAGSASEDDDVIRGRWSRKDQKAMLAIFAQFVNPKVLYKSAEVHKALLSLCANGDVEIQRSALKAIAAWKEPAVTRHQEHLVNLLDDACFSNEMTVFLQDDTEDTGIRADEYDALMPVLLRLLYGRAVAGGKEGQTDRRRKIFRALSRFGETVLGNFLDIALSSLGEVKSELDVPPQEAEIKAVKAPLRQQLGLLNMMHDMLETLGSEMEVMAQKLLYATLLCTVSAFTKLQQEDNDGVAATHVSLLRTVRQTGIQCLVKIFLSMKDFNVGSYGTYIVDTLIQPRLSTFVEENAQSISGTLRLLHAWTARNATADLFKGTGRSMLTATAGLLCGKHTKDEVRLFILKDIVENLTSGAIDESILQPAVSDFVKSIGLVIQREPSREVLDRSVKTFSLLAGRISNGEEAVDVVRICTDLLRKPGKDVSQGTKGNLLRTLVPLIEKFQPEGQDDLFTAICPLFSRLHEAENRTLLAKVLQLLVRDDPDLLPIAQLCEDMAAMGTRLDEPDYDRREKAFRLVFDSSKDYSLKQWAPIIHNCLFFIRDADDRVNRTSASGVLNLFVDAVADRSGESAWLAVLDSAVYTGIEHGMKAPSELVRMEYLNVLGHVVEKLPEWSKVKSMNALVVGGDEEASFFTNALHIQQHRRLRALKRLADEASALDTNAVTRTFLPLLEHFVFDQAEGDAGRALSDQAVQTIGVLAQAANWHAFRTTFQRYVSYLKSKPELEKTVLRLLGSMVDGLNREIAKAHSESIIRDQLPPLLEYLHQKDQSEVDRRMPVAVTIVKLLLMLPEVEFAARLPAVLTDVAHVLQSKAQEARDETRKALATISTLVGSQYFKFILKELRSALKRGYQLHVLSYTVHSLLVHADFQTGELDECVPELMLVIMDDIFGVTGQEKDAEDYKSAKKEVKSNKSYDTMELLARITPIAKLGELVRPIRALLSEKIDLRIVKKVDDLLTRLRKGLDQNPASESRDMLSFCWEVVNQVYAEDSAVVAPVKKFEDRVKRYLVLPEAKDIKTKNTAISFRFKLSSFALNLLRKILRRHEDLQTPQNLIGFLPIIGDAVVQGQEEVKLAAVRLLSTIMRVPIPQLDSNAPVYLKEAVAMVKGATNTTSDSSKAALELITAVLRERRSIDIREKDVATLLKIIKPDIDEPDRQGIIYRFIRALVGRKIVITEVYEVMDEVSKAMVTNPDRSIRESARSAYLQFVMEYPQGKDRWQKQTGFMIGNLRYDHASGRQSVMEFMHQILAKIGDDVLEDMVIRVFVSLLPVLVSDSDVSCRDMAGLLVEKIFERADERKVQEMLTLMETWLKKDKKATTKVGALKCWAILLRAQRVSQKTLEDFRTKMADLMASESDDDSQVTLQAFQTFTTLVESYPAIAFARKSQQLWTLVQKNSESPHHQVREIVSDLMGSYFTDLASTSSKAGNGLAVLPLKGSGGLELGEEDMRHMCAILLRAMRLIDDASSERLRDQNIRNLVFLGRCFAVNGVVWQGLKSSVHAEESDSEDDTDDEASAAVAARGPKSALSHLLAQLSKTVLRPSNAATARLAAMSCIGALLPHLSVDNLPTQSILRPLFALTDPSIPNPPTAAYKSLEDKANELLDQMQKKLGNQAYVSALAVTRAEAKARRDQRRQKRRIEAVSAPEKYAKDKKKKYEAKKAKTKAKGEEARGKRRGW